MTLLAPRIVNDVSHVTRINHKIHFAWRTQFWVSLKGDFILAPRIALTCVGL